MNEFVDECRSEWSRLGVPAPVADEMAAELAADLEEAKAEGVSAEELLGSGAVDPRSFAAAWAAERGVVQPSPPNGLPRRSLLAAALGVLALVAIIGGVLVIASPSGPTRLALTAPGDFPASRPTVVRMPAPPPGGGLRVTMDGEAVRVNLPPPPSARILAVDVDDSGVDTRTLGWVLLAVGLAGVTPLTMLLLWTSPRDRLRRGGPQPL